MNFATKDTSQLDYMQRLANLASTLAECNTHECHEAANLIGKEIQSLVQPEQQSAQHAGDVNGCDMASSIGSNPNCISPAVAVDPVAAAVEAVKLARAICDKADRNQKASHEQSSAADRERTAARKAYAAAEQELSDAISASVRQ